MQVARRLYVYVISGVSLGFVLSGVQSLVQVLVEALGGGAAVVGIGGASQQLSVALSLVGVGTPVWLIHWWFAERSVTPGRVDAESERRSAVRALYFAGLLAILLLIGAGAGGDLVSGLLGAALVPRGEYFGPAPANSLALLLVVGAAWAYHAAVRRRDMGAGELQGAAVWMPRAYLFLAAGGGLLWLLTSSVPIIDGVVRAAFGQTVESFLWIGPVATAVISLPVWVGHWWYADRLRRGSGWRAASERRARIRLGYLVAIIAVGVIGTISLLSAALGPLIRAALPAGSVGELGPSVIAPLLAVVPFASIGWWLHVRILRAEADADVEVDRPTQAWRLELMAVALPGLAFAAVGTTRLIAIVLEAAGGGGGLVAGESAATIELSVFVPLAVLGAAAWLSAWIPVERRRRAYPAEEAASTVRRAALLLVLGSAVLSGLASVALILYRLFGALLGAGLTGNAVTELSTPIGVLVVAVVVGLYHGVALRRDLELAPAAAPPTPAPVDRATEPPPPSVTPAEATWEGEGGVVTAPGMALTLRGPDGDDLEAALAAARAALPEGYRLERD